MNPCLDNYQIDELRKKYEMGDVHEPEEDEPEDSQQYLQHDAQPSSIVKVPPVKNSMKY